MTILQYALSYADGEVYGFIESESMPVLAAGQVAHVMIERVNGWPVAPSPTARLYINNGELSWAEVAQLSEAKSKAWEAARSSRDKAEMGIFEFNGDWYDINKENVSGAALAALMAQLAGQPFSINWTLADNSVKTLDGSQMQQLGIAMVQHIDMLHSTARDLRQQIEAATEPEQAYAVTWPMNQYIKESNDA